MEVVKATLKAKVYMTYTTYTSPKGLSIVGWRKVEGVRK